MLENNLLKGRRNWLRLSLAVMLLLVVSFCFQLYLSYGEHLRSTDQNLENLSLALIKQAESELRSTEIALNFAREKMEQNKNPRSWKNQEVYDLFRGVLATFGQADTRVTPHDLFWVDPTGVVRVTSYSNPTPEIIASDRSYFNFHKADQSPDVFYSGSLQSRLTNRWVIYQTVRINDDKGEFAGVIGISTRIDAFEYFYRQLELAQGSSIIIGQRRGDWSYHYPFDPSYAEVNFFTAPEFETMRQEQRGQMVLERSPFDQLKRRVGYCWLEPLQLLAVVTISHDAVNRAFYPVVIQRGVLLFITVAVLVAAMLAYSRLSRDGDAALRLANYDELTQIPNRRYLDDRLQHEWRNLQRTNAPLGMLFIDIDYFKNYNDQYGHQAGDRCLKQVARLIKQELRRPNDFVARYGGEEFVVLLPGNNFVNTKKIADIILESIRNEKILHVASPISSYLSVSIGYASIIPDEDLEWRSLQSLADRALYEAKNTGRNRACGGQTGE